MFLPDVNLLIAFADEDHAFHGEARRFFGATRRTGWATCPITENGFLRIMGGSHYPKGFTSPEHARVSLKSILVLPGHQFWPDELSLADIHVFPSLPAAGHLTDLYLLGLAVKRGAKLATFDRRIDPSLVPGGPEALKILKNA